MVIIYPRTCPDCESKYSDKCNFSRHKRVGVCEKRQAPKVIVEIAKEQPPEYVRKVPETTINDLVGLEKSIKSLVSQNLYLVQMCHHVSTGEKVFKCGRSAYSVRRLQDYPRGSILIASLPVTNMRVAEHQLLSKMGAKFKPRKDHGSEFFEGPLVDIMNTFIEVCTQFKLT